MYRGAPTDLSGPQVRAHQFADEIIGKLSGGLPGIASTQITFVSSRGGSKEIWVMDYDGSNQRQLTTLKSIALTPRWSPDASAHRFHLLRAVAGLTSAQICMYSMDTGKLVSFPVSAEPTSLPHGLRTARKSSFHLPCKAIRTLRLPTPAAAAPSA